MAKVGSWKNAFISVNGTVLSDHANQISIDASADEVDITGFGPSGFREFDQGFKDVTINATFLQDFATGSVDALLQPMFTNNTAGTVVVRPSADAVSATNPSYTLIAKLYSYGPLAGGLGDALSVECAFRHSGTAGLVRGTA